MNDEVKLSRGISVVIEILLHVSILKPSHEQHQTVSAKNKPKVSRVPTFKTNTIAIKSTKNKLVNTHL